MKHKSKWIIIFSVVIIIISIVKVVSNPSVDRLAVSRASVETQETTKIVWPEEQTITVLEYQEILEQKESHVIYHYSEYCPDCDDSSPVIQQLNINLDNKIMIFNASELDANGKQFAESINLKYVPTIIFYEQGIETNRMEEFDVNELDIDNLMKLIESNK